MSLKNLMVFMYLVVLGIFLGMILGALPKDALAKETYTASGTGFFINDEGYLLTADHVIADKGAIIYVKYFDNVYPAAIIARDSKHDVAILKINIKNNKYLTLDSPIKGEPIGIIGFPAPSEFNLSIKKQIGRILIVENEGFVFFGKVCRGNSGGPAIDSTGNALGIMHVLFTDLSLDNMNICSLKGMAVSLDPAIRLLQANKISFRLNEHKNKPNLSKYIEYISVNESVVFILSVFEE